MKVLLVLVALTALGLKSQAQNSAQFIKNQWNVSDTDRAQWKIPALNRTEWNFPVLNETKWNDPALNRTQASNRTQNITQPLNTTVWNRNGTGERSFIQDQAKYYPAAVGNNTSHSPTHNGDILVGRIGIYDRLLFNQTFKKESRWWSGREKTVKYPQILGKYGYHRHETITAIRIYNKFYGGLHSSARISSGGVGYRYVKIKLSSPWNRGFEYLVQLFGH